MSGNRCDYYMCEKSTRKNPGLRKFHFPIKDENRCKQWILNSGNKELLNASLENLKNKFICGDHFRKEDFLGRKLVSTAVPLNYTSSIEMYHGPSTSRRTYHAEWTVEQITSSPHKMSKTDDEMSIDEVRFLTPSKREVGKSDVTVSPSATPQKIVAMPSPPSARKKLKLEESRSKSLEQQLYLTTKKLKKTERDLQHQIGQTRKILRARELRQLPPYSRALTRMQLYHRPRTPWTGEEKSTAICMYYKSPSLYKFLRRKKVVLPSPSTIKLWLSNYKTCPGFNKKLFKRLQYKADTMSRQEKKCIVMFDEMDIKEKIEFSRKDDMIKGFQDLGEFGRQPTFAKKALVVSVRGIYSEWKVPVAYYFSEKGVPAGTLKDIVEKNISLLEDTGLIPVAIVCDQGTSNQSLFRKFGVCSQKPYFEMKKNGKQKTDGKSKSRIFTIFDVPHLLKSLRNNLLQGDFILNNDVISFDIIRDTYSLDKRSNTGRALLKLTEKHLNPNAFQKFSVRLAAQIFSKSVAAAIRTAVATGQLKDTKKALSTANFIGTVNDLFDALNSKTLFSEKPCGRALCVKNTKVLNAIEEGYATMEQIFKKDKRGNLTRPPSFDGVLLSISAIKMLYEEEKKENADVFLLTRRLNQDPLENLFSIIRQRGGYNRNPTVRTFEAALKSHTVLQLMRPPEESNCEADEDHDIFNSETVPDWAHVSDGTTEETIRDKALEGIELLSSSSSDSDGSQQLTLEDCTTLYFAGYLIKKCLEKFDCANCKMKFQSSAEIQDEKQIFIFYKEYDIEETTSLIRPTELMQFVTKLTLRTLQKKFKMFWGKPRLTVFLRKMVLKKIERQLPTYLEDCKEHRLFIIDLLIRTFVYKQCKMLKKPSSNRPQTKISIWKHE